jgi:HPt (histidine-containing phosphotransfer) domain-containing protein
MEDEQKCTSELETAIQNQDVKEIYVAAHTIKGVAANLSLKALTQFSYNLEMIGKSLQKAKEQHRAEIQCPLEIGPVRKCDDMQRDIAPLFQQIKSEFVRVHQWYNQNAKNS